MKNIRCIVLCIISILCIGNTTIVAQGVNYWDGSDTTVWTQGNGSMGMPYLIESAGNLACLAKRVNEGTNYTGVYFKLTTNLNLAAGNWTPIGISTTNYFSGYFDGDYYTIDSLTISVTATTTSFVGLFGIVQNSIIQKVILSNVNVSQTSASANIFTGGLLGATINGDYISNCSVLSGHIYSVSSIGNKGYAGGIVGCSQFGTKNLRITNCNNNAQVCANYAVGGIVGMLNVTSTETDTVWLTSCFNTGLINGISTSGNIYTGGVIGWLNLSKNNTICYVDNCYNTAYVKDSTHGGLYIYTGGLIGYLQNSASAITGIAAYISNSWNSGKVENVNTLLEFTKQKWSYVAGITGNTTIYGVASLYYTNVYNSGDIYFFRKSPQTTSAVGGILGLIATQQAGGLISLQQTYNIGNITLASPDTSNTFTFTGGIIGWLYNDKGRYEIDKCFNNGNITNDSYYSGGIVGNINGFTTSGNILSNCLNSGNIKSKNTSGGIMAYYVNKSPANTFTNCISVGLVCAIDGGCSGIAGVLGDSTTLNLASCYYDRQITNMTQGALARGLNSSCINDTLRYARQIAALQLNPSIWYMENNMYPRFHCMKDMDEMILAATPIFFYADTAANVYNSVSEVNRSFCMGGKACTRFLSSQPSLLTIINNDSALLTASTIDTLQLTVSYGTASKTIDLIVKPKPSIDIEDTITYCSNELPVFYKNLFINTAGDYTIKSTLSPAYDTNFTIHVIVNQAYDTVIMQMVSDSQLPFIFGSQTLTKEGVYQETFQTVSTACDSVVHLVLVIKEIEDLVPICMVSVDTNNYNVIVWEKPSVNYITDFNIYRETNEAGNYEWVKTVPFAAFSTFIDSNSNASQKAYRYKLAAMTNFGYETDQSPYHQTIHLTINKGIGNKWNLIWSPYEGLEYTSYTIYRGTSKNDMVKLTEISSSFNSFTDDTIGNVYYQIVANVDSDCQPIGTMSLKSNDRYNTAKSNIVCNEETNIESAENNIQINIYPNPAKEYVDISWGADVSANELVLYDIYGKIISKRFVNDLNTRLDLSEFANGVYILQVKNKNRIIGNYKIVRNK